MLLGLGLEALDKAHKSDLKIVGEFLVCFFLPVGRRERACLDGILDEVDLNEFEIIVEDSLDVGWNWGVLLMKGLQVFVRLDSAF